MASDSQHGQRAGEDVASASHDGADLGSDMGRLANALVRAMDDALPALGYTFTSVAVWSVDRADGSAELFLHWPNAVPVVAQDVVEIDQIHAPLSDAEIASVVLVVAPAVTESERLQSVVAIEATPPIRSAGGRALAFVVRAGPGLEEADLADRAEQLAEVVGPFARLFAALSEGADVWAVKRTADIATLTIAAHNAAGDALRVAISNLRNALGVDVVAILQHIEGRLVSITELDCSDGRLLEPVDVVMGEDCTSDNVDVVRSVAGRFGRRQVGRPSVPLTVSLGEELTDRFPVLAQVKTLVTVPLGSKGRTFISIGRCSEGDWEPEVVEALAVFGVRVGSVVESGFVEEAKRRQRATAHILGNTLSWIGHANKAEAEIEVEALVKRLGLQQGLRSVHVDWADTSAGCLQPVVWRAPEVSWALEDADSAGLASSMAVPIGSSAEQVGTVRVVWGPDVSAPVGLVALAGILQQVEERLRREQEMAAADRIRTVLGSAAARLVAADSRSLAGILDETMGDFGAVIEADLLVLCRVDALERRYIIEASWRADATVVPLRKDIPFDEGFRLDAARVARRPVEVPDGERAHRYPARLLVPVASSEAVEHILVVARADGFVWEDAIVDAAQRFAELLSSAVRRVTTERYVSMAFDHAPTGVAIRSEDGLFRYANRAMAQLFGFDDVGEFVGRSPDELMVDPESDPVWTPEGSFETARVEMLRRGGPAWIARVRRRLLADVEPGQWVSHITDVTDSDRAKAQLRHAAMHDPLTGLPNRRALQEAIETNARKHHTAALLMLDLDRFKNVNDSMGHGSGDELLTIIGDRLLSASRPEDLVVRLGGDEFALFLEGPTNQPAVQALATRLLDAVAEPTVIDRQTVYPTASLGIALTHASDGRELLRSADLAMYQAKDNGGNRWVIFDDELKRTIDMRHRTETGLRAAMDDDRLAVAYQPEVDLITGELLGAEALMRWRRTESEFVDAAEFVAAAEATGLITPIGRRVLETACAEAATWPRLSPRPLTVRVNLSAAELHHDDLVSSIVSVLEPSGLDPTRLCLEVTESAAMRDVARSEDALNQLHDLGIELAIDDFGTGYSSLAYLKRFPFDTLKIDGSFVQDLATDPDDTRFVESVISLAESLGLSVVAEGIETQAQVDILVALGCRRGQGYWFGKPGPAAGLRARIAGS